MALAGMVLLAFPTTLGTWVSIGLLLLVGVAAVGVQRWADRLNGVRPRLFGPLALFGLVFVVILAVRAITLAAGGEGRFFDVDDAGRSEWRLSVEVRRDLPETGSLPVAAGPRSTPPAVVRVVRTDAAVGTAAYEWTFRRPTSARYASAVLPGPLLARVPVFPGEQLGYTVAVKPLKGMGPGTRLELHARFYDRSHRHLSDVPVVGAAGRRRAAPAGRWTTMEGLARAPASAAESDVRLLARGSPPGRAAQVLMDAPVVVPGARRVADIRPFTGRTTGGPWSSAFPRALAIAASMMLFVLCGFLLSAGHRIAQWLPALGLARRSSRSSGRLVCAGIAVGVIGWLLEMRSYGGYGGYLGALQDLGVEGNGRWYLHTVATVPTGMAVAIAVRWLVGGAADRPTKLEWIGIVVGVAIACSYFLKTTVALPLLVVLLCVATLRPRASLWLGVFGAALAVLTPFVYLVRGNGSLSLSPLLSSSYWQDFFPNLTSRFFHFESLMITTPYPASEPVWQPLVDLSTTAVPRTFWEGKPLSAATRFTHDHLLPGLHSATDIGIISLPGEAWQLGGAVGIAVFGVALGIILRALHHLLRERSGEPGTLLVGCIGLAGVLFLNDGWGIVSALVTTLIAVFGTLVFLRRSGARNDTNQQRSAAVVSA